MYEVISTAKSTLEVISFTVKTGDRLALRKGKHYIALTPPHAEWLRGQLDRWLHEQKSAGKLTP